MTAVEKCKQEIQSLYDNATEKGNYSRALAYRITLNILQSHLEPERQQLQKAWYEGKQRAYDNMNSGMSISPVDFNNFYSKLKGE